MLFNSYVFILLFLPVVLLGFHLIGNRGHHRIALAWLVGASLFFYGWWNPAYLGLILTSILFNYVVGLSLGRRPLKSTLIFGIVINLAFIAYFKYANFFVDNLNQATGSTLVLEQIILPLAISFFTFQQIAYLIDAYKGETKDYDFLHYCLFVTFFPQLIAGPIVHHKEMLPQFASDIVYKLKASHLAIGLTIFILGLFKKVVLADNIAIYSTPVFEAAENGTVLTLMEAWGGAMAYTFQLYFDFSGYSDMAIGIARMFGIVLPINFYSPYKANNIIEFWRRWHITLSRFLKDYLYIPLGGSRKGNVRRYVNLMITMLLGGLWHGAGWTFILWGAMHGLYLSINHGWNSVSAKLFPSIHKPSFKWLLFSRTLTFLAIVVAWVMFRAESLTGALNMYAGMFGFNGMALPVSANTYLGEFSSTLTYYGFTFGGMFHNEVFGDADKGFALIIVMIGIVWFAPNTIEIMKNEKPALNADNFLGESKSTVFLWKPTWLWSILLIVLTYISLTSMLDSVSEFLYFQF